MFDIMDIEKSRPLAYSVREAAKLLGMGHNKAYNLVNSGALASIILGGRHVVLPEALDAYKREAATMAA